MTLFKVQFCDKFNIYLLALYFGLIPYLYLSPFGYVKIT